MFLVGGSVVGGWIGTPSPDLDRRTGYGMRTPEIARAITRRWISEVPSKIV
jgi:hypothetical protein